MPNSDEGGISWLHGGNYLLLTFNFREKQLKLIPKVACMKLIYADTYAAKQDIEAPRRSIALTIIRQWRRYEHAIQSMFLSSV